jgi:hypothetical protein
MIAFDLASVSFGTSLLQRLQQFAPELSPRTGVKAIGQPLLRTKPPSRM